MVNPLSSPCFLHVLSVLGSELLVAQPNNIITIQRPPQQRTILGPTLWWYYNRLQESLCDPSIMQENWHIQIY